MASQTTDFAVQADEFSWTHIGIIPGCVALGCVDIGEATVDGKKVFVTWGRNLDAEKQQWFAKNTNFQPVRLGADDGSAELVLPDDVIQSLLPILIK